MTRVCNLYSLHCHQWHRGHSLLSAPGPKSQAKDRRGKRWAGIRLAGQGLEQASGAAAWQTLCHKCPGLRLHLWWMWIHARKQVCRYVTFLGDPTQRILSGKGTAIRIRWTKQWPIRAAAQVREKYSVLTHKECVIFTSLGLLICKNEKLGQLLIFSGA